MIDQYSEIIIGVLTVAATFFGWMSLIQRKKASQSNVKLKNSEVRLAEVTGDNSNFRALIEVIAQSSENTKELAVNIGVMARAHRESSQQYTSAIEAQTEAQNEATKKLKDMDSYLQETVTATKLQVDRAVEIFQKEISGLAIRLDSLPTLFTDNQVNERQQLTTIIVELMALLEKATGIVETCKISNNKETKDGSFLVVSDEQIEKGEKE